MAHRGRGEGAIGSAGEASAGHGRANGGGEQAGGGGSGCDGGGGSGSSGIAHGASLHQSMGHRRVEEWGEHREGEESVCGVWGYRMGDESYQVVEKFTRLVGTVGS